VWFNQEPIDFADWREQPGAARIERIKSVTMSDGSSRRFYLLREPTKKLQQTKTPREKRVKQK